MSPRRLIDIEVLKQGEALLKEYRRIQRNDPFGADQAQQAWMDWAALYAGDIMNGLKGFAALEEILDHTWITNLTWWGTPGAWGLETDVDQVGESEGEWNGTELYEVLCAAAADFAAADEFDAGDTPASSDAP